MPGGVLNIPMT